MKLSDWITRRFLIELAAVCLMVAGAGVYTGRHWTSTAAFTAIVIAMCIGGQYARKRAMLNFERDRQTTDYEAEIAALGAAHAALLRQLGAQAAYFGCAVGLLPLLWQLNLSTMTVIALCLGPSFMGGFFMRTWSYARSFNPSMNRAVWIQSIAMGLLGICAGLIVLPVTMIQLQDLAFSRQMTVVGYRMWDVLMFGGLAIVWVCGLLLNRALAKRAERRAIIDLK